MTISINLKKTLSAFVVVLFLTSGSVIAQGNLQFNQAKLVSSVETVPANKVWKVESIISNSAGASALRLSAVGGEQTMSTATSATPRASDHDSRFIAINGTNYAVDLMSTSTVDTFFGSAVGISVASPARSYSELMKLPLWLPAGTTLAAATNVSLINVIEFNIVP